MEYASDLQRLWSDCAYAVLIPLKGVGQSILLFLFLLKVKRYKCRITPCGAVMGNNKYAIGHLAVEGRKSATVQVNMALSEFYIYFNCLQVHVHIQKTGNEFLSIGRDHGRGKSSILPKDRLLLDRGCMFFSVLTFGWAGFITTSLYRFVGGSGPMLKDGPDLKL